jgi:hypothetical protein
MKYKEGIPLGLLDTADEGTMVFLNVRAITLPCHDIPEVLNIQEK